jgi:ornithine cyclodeaminase/alanine dehydrogenase-like protein (mu-crystallin family)
LFGAGVQGRTQLMAVCEVRPIDRVVVCDPLPEARQRFAKEMAAVLSVPITPTEDPGACLDCDIVVTATSSKTPLFDGRRLRPGTHINGVGSHSPDARELDSETVRRSVVVADHAPARLAEDGDLIVPLRDGVIGEDHIQASLGEVVEGLKPGRRSRDEITLFKSGGLAVQDAATAARVYELARAAGVGREFEI